MALMHPEQQRQYKIELLREVENARRNASSDQPGALSLESKLQLTLARQQNGYEQVQSHLTPRQKIYQIQEFAKPVESFWSGKRIAAETLGKIDHVLALIGTYWFTRVSITLATTFAGMDPVSSDALGDVMGYFGIILHSIYGHDHVSGFLHHTFEGFRPTYAGGGGWRRAWVIGSEALVTPIYVLSLGYYGWAVVFQDFSNTSKALILTPFMIEMLCDEAGFTRDRYEDLVNMIARIFCGSKKGTAINTLQSKLGDLKDNIFDLSTSQLEQLKREISELTPVEEIEEEDL